MGGSKNKQIMMQLYDVNNVACMGDRKLRKVLPVWFCLALVVKNPFNSFKWNLFLRRMVPIQIQLISCNINA